MNDPDNVAGNCGECDGLLREAPSLAFEDRKRCPTCGSMPRKFVANLVESLALTDHPQVVVSPTTFRVAASFPQGTVTVTPPLPTEVVTNALHIEVNLLEPDEKNQWGMDVSAFGKVGFAAVGNLDDVVTEAAIWLTGLAERWERKLKDEDD